MARNDTLILEVSDFKDLQHWRWVLKDSMGKFLQDFEVSLNSNAANYAAFQDLYGFLEANSSPDRWLDDQIKLIQQVGSWIGREALGCVGERIAKFITPVTVKVLVPPEASGLLYRPWEIAMLGDKPLALSNVCLVFEILAEKPSITAVPVQNRLRMLAVFSLPVDASALSLRRERYQLMKLINQLSQSRGFVIEMRVLQYGTTRQSLQEALEEGEGWDLIHFSGHGDKARLILENPDGSHDPVTSEDLSALLSLASGRLKLVTLSACLSAAATVQETLEWLKIPVTQIGEPQDFASQAEAPMSALAVELMTKLDCTVLAMRYPVGDEFAINLASDFYRLLLEKGNTLPRSLQLAMQKALKDGYNAATPPLSLATPALFGSKAAEMIIRPPEAKEGQLKMPTIGLAYVPPEPKRFVGRTGPLGRASSAMSKESDKRGVLFHGMAGAGKTACALETAYQQSRSYRFRHFIWHQAPKENEDIEGALVRLALDMEREMPGFKMAHLVDRAVQFREWLPVLSETLEQYSILIVIDNLENLLTSDGGWKDERWGWLVEALLDHDGLSRIVLTSRKLPTQLVGNNQLIIEPINALSLSEAILLAREMPNLSRLLIGKCPVGLEKGRDLVRRTLSLVQGHPKLIELADAQAAHPRDLERHLVSALEAWGGAKDQLDRFFLDGESARMAEEFLKVLTKWSKDAARSLPRASRTLFRFLCALENDDRMDWIVKQIWPEFWKGIGLSGDAPELEATLSSIETAGLVESQSLGEHVNYIIHPGVAQAGMEEVNETFRAKVDSGLTSFWVGIYAQMLNGGFKGKDQWVIRAGLRSATYLIKQKKWTEAAAFLEPVIQRDNSQRTMATVLTMLRYIDKANRGTDQEPVTSGFLATALLLVGRWQDAENIIRPLIHKFAAQGDFISVSTSTTILIRILNETGRFNEALEQAKKLNEYTLNAGLGPWTQLSDEAQKLQVLNSLGRYDIVLEAVKSLREQIRSLPEDGNYKEICEPWNVKEAILDDGREAAMRSEKYRLALEYNVEMAAFAEARGATNLELAKIKFNDYVPHLRLKQFKEATTLIRICKDTFDKEKDIKGISCSFCALADLSFCQSQVDQAIRFEEISLRYSYMYGDPSGISLSHNNLAIYRRNLGSKIAIDHGLAALIIRYQINSGMIASSSKEFAMDFAEFGPEALPESFDQLCNRVEQVVGVRFRELWQRLPKRAEDGDQLLKALIEAARGAKP